MHWGQVAIWEVTWSWPRLVNTHLYLHIVTGVTQVGGQGLFLHLAGGVLARKPLFEGQLPFCSSGD